MRRSLLILSILIFIVSVCGCNSPNPGILNVTIVDAYCDNNGHFNYTIANARSSDLIITYKWHLDDPKAGTPRPIWKNGWTSDYYVGNGTVKVPGNGNQTVIIPLQDDPNYPMMDLVMDVELFDGNTSIYHYREQKYNGTYKGNWDYSTLPPKQR